MTLEPKRSFKRHSIKHTGEEDRVCNRNLWPRACITIAKRKWQHQSCIKLDSLSSFYLFGLFSMWNFKCQKSESKVSLALIFWSFCLSFFHNFFFYFHLFFSLTIFLSFPFLSFLFFTIHCGKIHKSRLTPATRKNVLFGLFISSLQSFREIGWAVGWKHWVEGLTPLPNSIHSTGSGTQKERLERVKTKTEKKKTEAVSHSLHLCEPRSPALSPSLSHDTVLSGLGGVIVKRCNHAGTPRPSPPSTQGEVFLFTSLTSSSILLHSVL